MNPLRILAILLFLLPRTSALGLQDSSGPSPLDFRDAKGRIWLSGITFSVTPMGKDPILCTDPRFECSSNESRKEIRYFYEDRDRVLDMEVLIRPLSDRSVRMKLEAVNRSGTDLRLDRITVLSGRRPAGDGFGVAMPNGFTSWSGPELRRLGPGMEAKDCHWTLGVQKPALAAGFLTGERAVNRFTYSTDASNLLISAWAQCDGCLLPAGSSRSTDELFLSAEPHPLAELERFADLAAEANRVEIWPTNFATWCSWYAGWIRQGMYEYKNGLEAGVEDNIPRVEKLFKNRRAAWMRIVDDSNDMPYGDWDDRTKAIPRGFSRLVDLMRAEGVVPGIWLPVYMVSDRTRFFEAHRDWLCRNAGDEIHLESFYGNTCGVVDTTHPGALAHFRELGKSLGERGYRYVMTDFLVRATGPARFHDPTRTKGEMHRQGLEALRAGFGPDLYWLGCGALLGVSMGLCDGMRISGDSFGDQPYSYLQTGYRWFYHRRLWLNDPDAIVCRGKSVPWNRAWMSWMALSGVVLTYGDTFDDLGEEHVAVYKRIFPPLNIAGRPLDLWENDPYLLWGVRPGDAPHAGKLLGVFHFDDPVGLELKLNLDEISARIDSFAEKPDIAPGAYLLWDFWKERLLESEAHALTIPLPDRGGRLFALREAHGRPQLLGTRGHFSQGALEITELQWDDEVKALTGRVLGNGGDPTTVFFHVPEGFRPTAATLGKSPVLLHAKETGVLALEVPALDAPQVFTLLFEGEAKATKRRPFVQGPAAAQVAFGQSDADPETLDRLRALARRTPLGYRLAAYLDCGSDSGGIERDGQRLRLVRGKPFTWKPAAGAAPRSSATVAFDEERIILEASGLDPEKPCQLGFTWWDYDNNGRVQTVRVAPGEGDAGFRLVDRTRLPAYLGRREGPESLLYLLPPEAYRSGRLFITFDKEAGMHNAVVSEVWLWTGK